MDPTASSKADTMAETVDEHQKVTIHFMEYQYCVYLYRRRDFGSKILVEKKVFCQDKFSWTKYQFPIGCKKFVNT